jgi:hypothetical protein
VDAIRQAYAKAGKPLPADFLQRTSGAREEGTTTTP